MAIRLSWKELAASSDEILAQNGGRMAYQAWKDAMIAKHGNVDKQLGQMVMAKRANFVLGDTSVIGSPELFVVAEVE